MTLDLAALDGLRVPGGCDHCDAYQEIHANWGGHGIHRLAVYHDDHCPWYHGSNRAARRARRKAA